MIARTTGRRGERRAAAKVGLKAAKATIDGGERTVLKLRLDAQGC